MGNSVRKLSHCCSCNGDSYEMKTPSHPSQDFVGHTFSYVRPGPAPLSSSASKVHSLNDPSSSSSSTKPTRFHSISAASVGANMITVPFWSSPLLDLSSRNFTFESSELFASLSLQPVPRGNSRGWKLCNQCHVEPGLFSDPIDKFQRSSSLGSLNSNEKSFSLMKSFKRGISNKMLKVFLSDNELSSDTERRNENLLAKTDHSSRGSLSADDNGDGDHGNRFSMESQNLQWAQGKAGEDRIHLVVSEEVGWIFVGIYDGFNGPDAPNHLFSDLFDTVFEKLKGLLCNNYDKAKSDEALGLVSFEDKENCGKSFEHSDVLKALSEALMKTEETYLKMANLKPMLHLSGSCVLVMLMHGDDVYLMNVGDSRAILAKKPGSKTGRRIKPPFNLIPCQLTKEHNADVQEEVERIRKEHPDDDEAVVYARVKGNLKVTRAFGAGFLKHPKWNDAILGIFRVNYVGTSPYITTSPSLRHYKLNPNDRFLILSSVGLYQYFTNQQVVSEVEWFTAAFPGLNPAQHLVEQVLIRAAEKAGLEFNELVEIPPGEDRLRYHDDVSLIIISLEGRIWRSSVS